MNEAIGSGFLEQLLKTAVANMCWMANSIHQAHHMRAEDDHAHFTWQACDRGICRSMEHMLAQVGFDKDLKPVPVRP